MQIKSLWIRSIHSWSAGIISINPAGDSSWISLSKLSGQANYPEGEFIQAQVTDNLSLNPRNAIIEVASGGTTKTVPVTQSKGGGKIFILVNNGRKLKNNDYQLINVQ